MKRGLKVTVNGFSLLFVPYAAEPMLFTLVWPSTVASLSGLKQSKTETN